MATAADQILILGVGNILLGDEGVGVWAIKALEERYLLPEGVQALDGGTAGMDLLACLDGIAQLIIIDAVKADGPAGRLLCWHDDEVPASLVSKISPHQLGLSDLLAAASLTASLPRRLTLLGIVPESIATGISLSTAARAGMAEAIAAVAAELRVQGRELIERTQPGPPSPLLAAAPLV